MSRLVREIILMEVLDHPNIVRLYETYETADALYLVMEYIPGYNLEEYLKSIDKNIIPESQARDIFRQVVKAVDHCHSKWVVHRDLKTPNVLLTADHQVKIADFGLGNRFGLQRLKTVCGSMLYYSPEIITARSYVGPEVDAWCLGIMLFRMTAGVELFSHAKTPTELKKYIVSRHYKFPSHLSPEIQQTIQKCLALDRYDRLSLKSFLSNDAWFNNYGTLEDVFQQRMSNTLYNALGATEAYAKSVKSDDTDQIQINAQNSKRQCKLDLQEERRRGMKVPKTVIYHITNPATYFTGPAHHSSQQPIDLEAQSQVIAELNQSLLVTLRQVNLQQIHSVTDLKSPISHLFRKFKRSDSLQIPECHEPKQQLRKAASALNLSQIYQRVAKDHICYFSIQCNIHTGSSTTVISGYSTSSTFVSAEPNGKRTKQNRRLSRRLSAVFFSNTLPDLHTSQQDEEPSEAEQMKCSQSEFLKIVRLVCEILGITYYQTGSTQLVCLLTLRNCNKKAIVASQQQQQHHQNSLFRSKLFSSSDRLSEINRQHKQTNSSISNSSTHSSTNTTTWWNRQVHRISAPFSSQSNLLTNGSSAAGGLVLGNSSYNLLSTGRLTQQEQQLQQQKQHENDQDEIKQDSDEPDGFSMLSIDVSSVSSSKNNEDGTPLQVIAVRYSKLRGSNKVFKLAKGWIQMILSQNSNEKKQFSRSDAEAYMKTVEAQQHQSFHDEADMMRV
ncbi:kinase-like domain-containing protein [Choanephora cucurbitarum]|nr:kinase-like domain-containing protein [Choanephora cucurbitarum]